MRVAVFSDVHGNLAALEAVLEDIERCHVDQVVCAGDIINPLKTSLEAWARIRGLGIPILRGNHEDYILSYFREPGSRVRNSIQFRPIQLVSEHLTREVADEFAALPLSITLDAENGKQVLVCHASPGSNTRSYFYGVNEAMERELHPVSASLIVGGHIHEMWKGQWRNKTLVIAGSTGLALQGKNEANYVIVESRGEDWNIEHRSVPYNHQATLQCYLESGWVQQGGPVGWMLYDEFVTAESRLARFFSWAQKKRLELKTVEDWETAVKAYLEKIGRWEQVRRLL